MHDLLVIYRIHFEAMPGSSPSVRGVSPSVPIHAGVLPRVAVLRHASSARQPKARHLHALNPHALRRGFARRGAERVVPGAVGADVLQEDRSTSMEK